MENQDITSLLTTIKEELTLLKNTKKIEESSGSLLNIALQKDVEYIKKEISEIKALVENKYVTMAEFQPIKNIVFGMVGLVLVSVVGGLLAIVLKK